MLQPCPCGASSHQAAKYFSWWNGSNGTTFIILAWEQRKWSAVSDIKTLLLSHAGAETSLILATTTTTTSLQCQWAVLFWHLLAKTSPWWWPEQQAALGYCCPCHVSDIWHCPEVSWQQPLKMRATLAAAVDLFSMHKTTQRASYLWKSLLDEALAAHPSVCREPLPLHYVVGKHCNIFEKISQPGKHCFFLFSFLLQWLLSHCFEELMHVQDRITCLLLWP